MPATDAVLMMLPPRPWALMRSDPCLMPRKTPRTSTAKVKSHSSAVVSPMGPKAPPTPALLKMQSSPWKRATASSTRPATSCSAATSPRRVASRSAYPCARASETVSASPASFRSPITTRALSRRNVSAVARPIPLPPPVMTATLPSRRPPIRRLPLPARLHPGLGPGQGGAAALPVAAHLGPHVAGRDLAVDLELGGAGGKEGAEDADRPVVEAGRRVEHEGLDAVVPGQRDPRVGGHDRLGGARPRPALPV